MTEEKKNAIAELLSQQEGWHIEIESNLVSITNPEDVVAFLYIGESQILVDTLLFPVDSVNDTAAFNELVLKTHHLLPLSSIKIATIDGLDFYSAFGALSVNSKDEVIVEEVEILFSNVEAFLELYSEQLIQES